MIFSKFLLTVGNNEICPVQAIYKYLQMFGHVSRPLFLLIGGEQVYAYVLHQNIKILQNTIRYTSIWMNNKFYKVHSFILELLYTGCPFRIY